ncbi:hypothetical protein QAD02_001269 [Eretmocerus hayati]|uniref:Uncharacterized protein n=1 Tax=Eretmocerus hayati TaxID=131215 RepID=A0ACC2NFS1_9HYME|nr:hypothetical protein QAD02_001269 [Eretmocerus hayati]
MASTTARAEASATAPAAGNANAEDTSSDDETTSRAESDDDSSIMTDSSEASMSSVDEDSTVSDDDMMNTLSFARLINELKRDAANGRREITFKVSKAEVMLAVLKFSLKHSLCNTAVAGGFEMFNTFMGKRWLPDTRYKVDKLLNPDDNVTFHGVCPQCKKYVSSFTRQDRSIHCQRCDIDIDVKKSTYKEYFALINIENELVNLVEMDADHYEKVRERCSGPIYDIRDFTDGQLYRKFFLSLPPDKRKDFITLLFSADGVPLFESSRFSIWPVQVIVNEISVSARAKKPIVSMIWFGKDKPDMNIFLSPFVSYMNQLSENGIICNIKGEKRKLHVFAICSPDDTRAREPMACMVSCASHYGCHWCLNPGVYIECGRGGAMKYSVTEEMPRLRIHEDVLRWMEESIDSEFAVFGFKRPSCLIHLTGFDMVPGFVPDPMHHADLGIIKQFTGYVMEPGQTLSLTPSQKSRIDGIVDGFAVPKHLQRLARKPSDKGHYKAVEWQNWGLHFSIPVYLEFPSLREFVKNWALFVTAYHKLMSDNITPAEIEVADRLMYEFSVRSEELLSTAVASYNLHQSLHLSQSVLDWGPARYHSCYWFEHGNGGLLKKVHAAKGVVHQVCRNVSLQQAELVLKRIVEKQHADDDTDDEEYDRIMSFVNHLDGKSTSKTMKGGNARYFGKPTSLSPALMAKFGLPETTVSFRRAVKSGCLYSSNNLRNIRSNNSFALTSDGLHIRISEFYYDAITGLERTLINRVDVEEIFEDLIMPIKRVIGISPEMETIGTDTIERICVFMEVGDKRYISPVPYQHQT